MLTLALATPGEMGVIMCVAGSDKRAAWGIFTPSVAADARVGRESAEVLESQFRIKSLDYDGVFRSLIFTRSWRLIGVWRPFSVVPDPIRALDTSLFADTAVLASTADTAATVRVRTPGNQTRRTFESPDPPTRTACGCRSDS